MSVQTPSPHTSQVDKQAWWGWDLPTGGSEWPGLNQTLHSTLSPSSFLIPISSLGLGTLWWLHFTLITSLKILPPYVLILRSWGLGHPHLNMGHSLAHKSPWTPAVFSVRGFLDPAQTYPSVFFPLKICCNLSLASLDHFVPWASYLLINLLSF